MEDKMIKRILSIMAVVSIVIVLLWDAHQRSPLTRATSIVYRMANKLEDFRQTGDFEGLFFDVEANKHIVGLSGKFYGYVQWTQIVSKKKHFWEAAEIEINGVKQYNYWNQYCYVLAQMLDNYFKAAGITSVILIIKADRIGAPLLPVGYPAEACKEKGYCGFWSYHMVNAVVTNSGDSYVYDLSWNNVGPMLLGEYLQKRFRNPRHTLHLCEVNNVRQLEQFLVPVKGGEPYYGTFLEWEVFSQVQGPEVHDGILPGDRTVYKESGITGLDFPTPF